MAKIKLTLDPMEIGTQALSILTGLFKSKKHYNLYYWEPADNTWKFVIEGHPSQVNPLAKQYAAQGYIISIIRNQSGTAVAPTSPPAGYEKSGATSTNWLMIVGVVLAVGFVLFFFLKRKRKR